MNVGHKSKDLDLWFKNASRKISNNKKLNKMPQSAIKLALPQFQQLFSYHAHCPKHMSRKCIQVFYKETCGPMLGDGLFSRQLTVAYHRPKNLKDLLTPSELKMCPGKDNNA